MVQDLKSGALDAAWGIPEAQFKPLASQAGIHTIAYNFFNWDYLDLNCSSLPSSTGNPVLRDVRFRDALNYAIDRDKLCQVAYEGLAAPATTIMPPDTWSNPDYHWQPPAAADLHLRPRQGQPAARRGRLPARRERPAPLQGQADHPAPVDRDRLSRRARSRPS